MSVRTGEDKHAEGIMRSVIVKFILAIAGICLTAIAVHAQDSPHGKLSVACDQCHDTGSWKVLTPGVKFKHSQTGFPLVGQHAQVACRQCHATLKFSEATDRCGTCHTDVHRNELGPNCERCHSSESWLVPDMPQRHVSTRFALLGAHRRAQCQACHTNEQKHTYAGAPIDCYSCHRNDYDATTAPAHRASGINTTCETCHSVSAAAWGGKFDHTTTGFPLVGSHAAVACAQCHKNNTFKGLPSNCASCHTGDYTRTTKPPHQSAGFGTDCVQCHAASSSTWTAKFDHAATAFPLVGSHMAVPCADCHKNNVYKGLPSTCFSCHANDYNATKNPPHLASGLSTDCIQCHSASSSVWGGKFDHATTAFPLTGLHATVQCMACHKNNVFKGLATTCNACHAADFTATKNPPHQAAGFGTDCAQCHTTTSSAWVSKFDHATTGFNLAGSHAAVPCVDCHKNNVYKGLPSDCYSCHSAEYTATTNPPHRTSGLSTDCNLCHSGSATTWGGKFDHSATLFPLTGAHVTVQCMTCHKNNVFKGLPANCYSCHAADYAATTTPPHQVSGLGTDCIQCHSASSTTWGGKFDHASTGFPLNGSHAAVPCLQCHKNNVFKGLPADCYSCHATDFNGTKNPPHQASGFATDCVTCHGTGAANWAGSFNHSQTGFALNGRHVGVACAQCHVNNVYKGLPSTCVSCHQQDYNASTNPNHTTSGFPTTCETCHSSSGWTPSTFDHEPSFPISATAVHRPGRWTSCADCHTSASDIRLFSCIGCHEHAQSSMDSKHRGNTRYSYSSAACYNCHPRGRE